MKLYLEIEQVRFEERLRVEFDIESGTESSTHSKSNPAAAGGECHQIRHCAERERRNHSIERQSIRPRAFIRAVRMMGLAIRDPTASPSE